MNAQLATRNDMTEAWPGMLQSDQSFPLPLILDILKRQIAISTGFLAILEAEKNALVHMDVSTLISLTRQKESELAKIAQLDHSLQEVARRIVAADAGSHHKTIKLAELEKIFKRT